MKRYEIRLLTKEFYDFYCSCPGEILSKENRPYLNLLVEIDEYKYAIPFRSNITHKYSYIFSSSIKAKSGLDFTKSIIIEKEEFIGEVAYIRDEEYIELTTYFNKILNKFIEFLKFYKTIIVKENKTYREQMIYNNSPLKYFMQNVNEN